MGMGRELGRGCAARISRKNRDMSHVNYFKRRECQTKGKADKQVARVSSRVRAIPIVTRTR